MSAVTAAVLLGLLSAPAPTRWIIGTERGADAQVRLQLREALRGTVEVRQLPFGIVVDAHEGAEFPRRLRGMSGIRWVEPEFWFRFAPRATPDDPLYVEQWYLQDPMAASPPNIAAHFNIESAWDITRGLTPAMVPIRIAVVDDGFDFAHPDLAPQLVAPGRDFSDFPNVVDDTTAQAGDWHGTWTAGVIAARGFDGVGITGACPACELIPVSLTRNGGPTELFVSSSSAAEAIVYATDAGADVINNSWGPPDGNPFSNDPETDLWPEGDPGASLPPGVLPRVLQEALSYAVTEGRGGLGTIITWSAGNGNELVTYDRFAADPRVLAIGAVARDGRRGFYSDFGPPIFAVAPSSGDGVVDDVITTDLVGTGGLDATDYYPGYGGTSASAALASGVFGLILAARPDLTAAQAIEAVAQSAQKIDDTTGDYVSGRSPYYGYGRIDPTQAIALAQAYGSDGCTLATELCGNDRDDDCNGMVDDDPACTPCVPNAPMEMCDGVDNNCDGRVDEDFVCESSGRPVCAPCTTTAQCDPGTLCRASPDFGGTWCFAQCAQPSDCDPGFTCDGSVCTLDATATILDCDDYLLCTPERCDGLDNDCNGILDDVPATSNERLAAGAMCVTTGVCNQEAVQCTDGAWVCDVPPGFELEETSCDGLDNDCDGEVDEQCRSQGCACNEAPATNLAWSLPLAALAFRRRRRSSSSS